MAKDIKVGGHEYGSKDYQGPPPAKLIDAEELTIWSFYRAIIAEFIATLLFLYITVLTVIGYKSQTEYPKTTHDPFGGVGILGIAWAFGGMIFVLVYCTTGISGHINPAVTFGLFLARKVSLPREVLYIVAQCLGAICGCGLVKSFQKTHYNADGGGANELTNWVSVFMVHLATTDIGVKPARSFGAAVIYGKDKAWDDQVQARTPAMACRSLKAWIRRCF